MSEQNSYGLSEGVYETCLYLGVKFPPADTAVSQEHVPSDYLGDHFNLSLETVNRLLSDLQYSKNFFVTVYKDFSKIFLAKYRLKQTITDLNIFFCDYLLFASKQNHAAANDYFAFEFYRKSFAQRDKFLTQGLRNKIEWMFNNPQAIGLTNDKPKTNKFFANFLHRDWLDTSTCTFEEFKAFVAKYPRFFSKLFDKNQGLGAEIINVTPNENLANLFAKLKNEHRLLEEIISQHESLRTFCPDTLNTIRVNTFLDVHDVVHIMTTSGRFGRIGGVVDNLHGGGVAAVINPETGIITSDGVNDFHERFSEHPDTGKTFKGFQYPCWKKVCSLVKTLAKMIPQLHHVGWDIAVNDKNEALLVEVNGNTPDVELQQAPDDTGRFHLYKPLIEEMQSCKNAYMQLLGYRVNNLRDFYSAYEYCSVRQNSLLQSVMEKLIPNCTSLLDLGCRRSSKFVKSLCPPNVKYFPVDYKPYGDEVIVCDFNDGKFPDVKADTCLCALTAEYVELLPQFLANMCNAAQKQILMLCRPVDKEIFPYYRFGDAYLTDFTEKFLLNSMAQNDFRLNAQYPASDNASVILYDFRRNLPST